MGKHKQTVHKAILDLMHQTYIEKDASYGSSVEQTYAMFGITAPVVRMNDKMNRLNHLVMTGQSEAVSESIDDTLLDLANYAVMTLMIRQIEREWRNKGE